MSDIEFDLFSNRSTSEISDIDYVSNCNLEDLHFLNEFILKRRNEHFRKSWEDNLLYFN